MYDDDSYPQHLDEDASVYDQDDMIDLGHSLPDSDPTEIHGLLEDLNLTDEEVDQISELLDDGNNINENNNEAPEDVPEEDHSHDISFKASSSCDGSCWNSCAGTCSGSCMVRDY